MDGMNISRPRSSTTQLELFDREQFIPTQYPDGSVNHGRIRTAVGEFFETLTAEILGAVRHVIDSRCEYCPDLSLGQTYLEVKAVGRSRQMFVYAGRLAKDRELFKRHPLCYVIWSHSLDTQLVTNVAQLKTQLRKSINCHYYVPFEFLFETFRPLVPVRLNSRYGAGRLYGSGYRLSLTKLAEFQQL